jgi:formiminotetrahydrofolate cyclodeaminase
MNPWAAACRAAQPVAQGDGAYNSGVQEPRDETRFRDLTLAEFVDRLASSDPIPGGGTAAAVSASLGAALVEMVANLSMGRERYAQHAANLEDAAATGRRLATRLLELAEEDAAAYGTFAAALKLPRETDEQRAERGRQIVTAARRAAEVPLETLQTCFELVQIAERLAGRSNVNAASDLSVAALLANTGAQAAAANVLVNLPAVNDPKWSDEITTTVVELQEAVSNLASSTREIVGSGESREPVETSEISRPSSGRTIALARSHS